MTIKPFSHSVPTKLPPAKLYLDDISEIVQILTDSSTDCQASFVAGASKCFDVTVCVVPTAGTETYRRPEAPVARTLAVPLVWGRGHRPADRGPPLRSTTPRRPREFHRRHPHRGIDF